MFRSMLAAFSLFLCLAAVAQVDHWESVILQGDEFRYLIPDSQPDASWVEPGFDDSSWEVGVSGFGYGDNDDEVIVPNTLAVYLRKVFTITDPAAIEEAILHMDYDDGFVAYLNGQEISRSLVSGNPPAYDQPSDGLHEARLYQGLAPEAFTFDPALLQEGENLLCVQVHNESLSSSDLSATPFLSLGITNGSMDYRPAPEWFNPPTAFTSSNLPIVVVQAQREISNDPKVPANLGIIYNGPDIRNHLTDPFNEYQGLVGIELRGESSLLFDKKSYGLEMWDESQNDLDTGFLDFPAEEDFILYGPYADKSLLNNHLAMILGNQLGHYASRTRFVELVINDDYKGLYVLMEKIKRDDDRVDIAKLNPDEISGDDLTGGYIIRIDKGEHPGWASKYGTVDGAGWVFFQYYYPNAEEIQPAQKTYIKSYIDGFEDAVMSPDYYNAQGMHYTQYINLRSFVDNFILNELSKNVDGYRLSTYFHKDKDSKGGKLTAGPLWDFNLSFGNADYCSGDNTSGWVYYQCDHGGYPAWWDAMLQDTLFTNALHCRWESLRQTTLSTSTINAAIDQMAEEITEAQARNYQKWPVMGTYLWPNSWFYAQASSHAEVITLMKEWIAERSLWIDENLPGVARQCDLYDDFAGLPPGEVTLGIGTVEPILYPNPASTLVELRTGDTMREVVISNLTGQVLGKYQPGTDGMTLSLEPYEAGIYLVRVKTDTQHYIRKLVVIK